MARRATQPIPENLAGEMESIELRNVAALAQLFQNTTKSQETLINNLITQVQTMISQLASAVQGAEDLIQILTTQAETTERTHTELIAVTTALTRVTAILRQVPPGSPITAGGEV